MIAFLVKRLQRKKFIYIQREKQNPGLPGSTLRKGNDSKQWAERDVGRDTSSPESKTQNLELPPPSNFPDQRSAGVTAGRRSQTAVLQKYPFQQAFDAGWESVNLGYHHLFENFDIYI